MWYKSLCFFFLIPLWSLWSWSSSSSFDFYLQISYLSNNHGSAINYFIYFFISCFKFNLDFKDKILFLMGMINDEGSIKTMIYSALPQPLQDFFSPPKMTWKCMKGMFGSAKSGRGKLKKMQRGVGSFNLKLNTALLF